MKYLIVALALAGLTGCPKELPPPGMVVTPKPTYPHAAVGFLDCGELKFIAYLDEEGGAAIVKVRGPAHLLDQKLLLATVPYLSVHLVENDRACGYSADGEAITQ